MARQLDHPVAITIQFGIEAELRILAVDEEMRREGLGIVGRRVVVGKLHSACREGMGMKMLMLLTSR